MDCVWDQWSAWDDCPVTCGGGIISRSRDEIIDECPGAPCAGPNVETDTCYEECCPGE